MVSSGSAIKGLWLGNRKVVSQVVGKTEADFLGEEQLAKLGEEVDKKEEPATQPRIDYIDFGSDSGEKDDYVTCHAEM